MPVKRKQQGEPGKKKAPKATSSRRAKKPQDPKSDEPQVGRPTQYTPEVMALVTELCEGGATIRDLSNALSVSLPQIYRWAHKYPEFREVLTQGRTKFDQRAEDSLALRALGYEYEETEEVTEIGPDGARHKTVVRKKHVVPDVKAAELWLINRQPAKWRRDPKSDESTKSRDNIIHWLESVGVADDQIEDLFAEEDDDGDNV